MDWVGRGKIFPSAWYVEDLPLVFGIKGLLIHNMQHRQKAFMSGRALAPDGCQSPCWWNSILVDQKDYDVSLVQHRNYLCKLHHVLRNPVLLFPHNSHVEEETMEERSKSWWRRAGEIVELHPIQYLHHTYWNMEGERIQVPLWHSSHSQLLRCGPVARWKHLPSFLSLDLWVLDCQVMHQSEEHKQCLMSH